MSEDRPLVYVIDDEASIREALDSVRESGGDVRELAYELWEPQ